MSLSYPQGYASCREPHCGVLSTAICAGVSFEAAWELIKEQARKPANWRGSTYPHERASALAALGVTVTARRHVPARHFPRLSPDYIAAHNLAKGCTVASFAAKAKRGVTYMVQMKGHVVTIRDGMVADQSGVKPAAQHWTAKRRVQTSWEIAA